MTKSCEPIVPETCDLCTENLRPRCSVYETFDESNCFCLPNMMCMLWCGEGMGIHPNSSCNCVTQEEIDEYTLNYNTQCLNKQECDGIWNDETFECESCVTLMICEAYSEPILNSEGFCDCTEIETPPCPIRCRDGYILEQNPGEKC